jgi:hypothetical protein
MATAAAFWAGLSSNTWLSPRLPVICNSRADIARLRAGRGIQASSETSTTVICINQAIGIDRPT